MTLLERLPEAAFPRWTRRFPACIDCGRSDRAHVGHGYCCACYMRWERRTKPNIRENIRERDRQRRSQPDRVEYGRRYYQRVTKLKRKVARAVAKMVKRCPGCGAEKPLSEYHRNPARPNGLERRCKQCVSAYKAAYYAMRHSA